VTRNFLAGLLDLLYPPKCVFCRGLLEPDEREICRECRMNLPVFDGPQRTGRYFSALCAPLRYEGVVRESLLRYKFGGLRQYAACYGELLAAAASTRLAGKFNLITWVPAGRRRRRKRGYDQALLLAEETGKRLGLRPVPTLRKPRDNPAQSSMANAGSRRANVMGVYEPVRPERFAGKRVLLIDDIITTGATLSEAARTLRTAGAADVVCAALAAADERENSR